MDVVAIAVTHHWLLLEHFISSHLDSQQLTNWKGCHRSCNLINLFSFLSWLAELLLLLLGLVGWLGLVRYLHFIYLYISFIWNRYSLFAASFLIISFIVYIECFLMTSQCIASHRIAWYEFSIEIYDWHRTEFIFIFIAVHGAVEQRAWSIVVFLVCSMCRLLVERNILSVAFISSPFANAFHCSWAHHRKTRIQINKHSICAANFRYVWMHLSRVKSERAWKTGKSLCSLVVFIAYKICKFVSIIEIG